MRPGLVDYDENISHLLARKQHMAALFLAKTWPFKVAQMVDRKLIWSGNFQRNEKKIDFLFDKMKDHIL